jgi:myo-inositol 2-dehydrogenase/D-chiro-inositol 1-dehydrogenase
MGDRPRVGIVGAGFIAEAHASAWAAEGVALTVHDVDPARAVALAGRAGAHAAASLDELLAAVDMVDVCTPTHLHAAVAIAAANAGRHVICEKPIARTLPDAEAMVAASGRAGVRLFVAHVVRFFPEYVAARQAVLDGSIGDVGVIRLTRHSFRPRQPAGHWFFDHAKSGGIVLDLMIHDLDYARWVGGEVVAVHCRSAGIDRPEAGVDHAVALLTHASGAISHVSASWGWAPPTFHTAFEIAGSHGLIEHDSATTAPVAPSLLAAAEAGSMTALADTSLNGDPFRQELAEFAAAIRFGTPSRIGPEDGLEALRIALAADESARTGSVVRIDRQEAAR